MRRRLLGVAGACLTALGATFALVAGSATTACTTHQCDSDFVNVDQSTGMAIGDVQPLASGSALSVWESSPIDGTWLDFPGERTYFFNLPDGFTPVGLPLPYIATGPNPEDPIDSGGASIVLAGGQLAEIGKYTFGGFTQLGFTVTNATCAEYYLYVSVLGYYSPPVPEAGPVAGDAGGSD